MRNRTVLIVVLAVIAAASLPLFAGPYFLSVFNTIFVYMSLALTWDMMLRTGQLSYGTAGLFGLGAYASALLVAKAGVNPLVSIAAGGVFAGLLAFFLGFAVLRLRKIYFSITTLALTTVFSVVIRNLPRLTGGASGTVLPRALFNGDPAKNYWMVLGLALAVIAISVWLSKSKTHYAINAIRNDEITARSSGIDVFRYLLFIFVLTSAIQGVIGAFMPSSTPCTAGSYVLYELPLLPLAMTLVGGVYSTIDRSGAVILGLVSEYLKLIMPYGHLIVYGIIIVLVVLFMPQGLPGCS